MSGYFHKIVGVLNQSFPSPRWAAKGYRATPARMPVIPLATRSQHVDFAYDQVVRPHRSYHPSGGLPRGKPRTRHMWICLQLSGARGVDNGGVKDKCVIHTYCYRRKTCHIQLVSSTAKKNNTSEITDEKNCQQNLHILINSLLQVP